jgi:hypothetical protein
MRKSLAQSLVATLGLNLDQATDALRLGGLRKQPFRNEAFKRYLKASVPRAL